MNRWLLLLLAGLLAAPAHAEVPLASASDDRLAKHATPAAGKSLLYVYRIDSAGAPTTITLNGANSTRLAPQTFAYWSVSPGRVELRAPGTGATTALQSEAGRVYYVELAHSSGGALLRQVPFAVGRPQLQRARLVTPDGQPAKAEKRAAPEKAEAPPPAAAPVVAADPAPAPASAPRPVHPARAAITLKLGSFKLGEDTQTVVGSARRFDAAASSVFALEGEWFVQPEFSVSVELLSFANDFTTTGSTAPGEIDSSAILFNAKYYFSPNSALQPYVGAGIGSAGTDFSGSITGGTGGLALQLVGGMQWRYGQLGLIAEYKYVSADTEDDAGQKVDVSGSGVFLGAGFHF